MQVETIDEWVARVAGRLRLLGANLQDESPATRQNFLTDELKLELDAVPVVQRNDYLSALRSVFPIGELGGTVEPATTHQAAPAVDELPLQVIVDELVTRSAYLSADERSELVRRLENCGLILPQQLSSNLEELPEELAKRLSLPVGERVNSRHAFLVLSKLVSIVLDLEQLVWVVWKTLSPRSRIRRESLSGGSEVGRNIGRYLTGDNSVPLADVVEPLERSRQLIAGLLGAIGPVGSNFARKFSQRFSPDDIRKHVRHDKKGFLKGLEVKCWEHYELMASDLTEDQVEHEIHDAITKFAESLIISDKY